jgi:hypothetical protein
MVNPDMIRNDHETDTTYVSRRENFIKHGIPAILAIGGITLGATLAVDTVHDAVKSNTCIASPKTITALRGDSLWTIAKNIDPEADPRVIISHLSQVNPELSSDPNHILHEGETLSVPICGIDK